MKTNHHIAGIEQRLCRMGATVSHACDHAACLDEQLASITALLFQLQADIEAVYLELGEIKPT